jgi:hypothetical protein
MKAPVPSELRRAAIFNKETTMKTEGYQGPITPGMRFVSSRDNETFEIKRVEGGVVHHARPRSLHNPNALVSSDEQYFRRTYQPRDGRSS